MGISDFVYFLSEKAHTQTQTDRQTDTDTHTHTHTRARPRARVRAHHLSLQLNYQKGGCSRIIRTKIVKEDLKVTCPFFLSALFGDETRWVC